MTEVHGASKFSARSHNRATGINSANKYDGAESPEKPSISIITVVFNGAQYLEKTITSVVNQNYKDIEYIVIDGGSTDGSVEIIEKYVSHITYWISESDAGIADAMNKGITRASGDFILFVHADDYLASEESIEKVVSVLEVDKKIHAFDVVFIRNGHSRVVRPRSFNIWMNFKGALCHQGVFCHRSLFQELGLFNNSYRICMDYEFFFRAYRSGLKVSIHHMPVAIMRDTGVSSKRDWAALSKRFSEERKIHLQYARTKAMRAAYYIYWKTYLSYRYLCWLVTSNADRVFKGNVRDFAR